MTKKLNFVVFLKMVDIGKSKGCPFYLLFQTVNDSDYYILSNE